MTTTAGPVGDEVVPEQPAAGAARPTGLTLEARVRLGKAARGAAPLAAHAEWVPDPARDPVGLIESQAAERVPELVPIRHGRMIVSPFAYFRGAALPMAADLASTPSSGLHVQLCGDAHLANFGFFGSPERHLFFDVNDFDETAPGPWEWDVKRLAVSLEVAARDHEYTDKERARIVRHAVRSYRETMREFAAMPMLDVWYAHLDIDDLLPRFQAMLDRDRTPAIWAAIVKARAHDSLDAFTKLCHMRDGEPRIVRDPPLIVPVEDFLPEAEPDAVLTALEDIINTYKTTLQPDRRHLIEQYRFVDLARKVVGVGSVGTACWIVLLADRDHESPLFLQVKEAQASVIERFTAASTFTNHGERVVAGQRLIQAASDIFLGWDRIPWDGVERDYYFRQLRDWKGSADVAGMTAAGMDLWGRMCGWTLARAHARTGDRIAIGAYLGKSDTFDRAIGDFAVAYADQSERDHRLLEAAVVSGRLEADTATNAKAGSREDANPGARGRIWWKADVKADADAKVDAG